MLKHKERNKTNKNIIKTRKRKEKKVRTQYLKQEAFQA